MMMMRRRSRGSSVNTMYFVGVICGIFVSLFGNSATLAHKQATNRFVFMHIFKIIRHDSQ
jgi:hypothetical protein